MVAILNTCASSSLTNAFNSHSSLLTPTLSSFNEIRPHASSRYRNLNRSISKSIVCFVGEKKRNEHVSITAEDDNVGVEEVDVKELGLQREALLYSFSPLSLMLLAALPGADTVKSVFAPFVEIVKSFDLPDWLVHWGHPGNMAVVLVAMGGYGTYLGFRIKFSQDVEEKAKAKDLHPKLLGGMFFFFALGATGGVTSLLTSDRPIFESPHAITGLIGLTLLTVQATLPKLFEGNSSLRNVHGILGSGIMTLFLGHAALGLQLGFSY